MKKIFLFVLAICAAFACTKDPAEKTATKLTVVTDDIVSVPYSGQNGILIEFICDSDWSAAIEGESADWLAIDGATSGKGSGKIAVSVTANDTKVERNATVKITAGKLDASVIIKQDAKKMDITFKHPSISFTDEQFAKLKAAYALPTTSSIKVALDFVVTRAKGSYNPAAVTDDAIKTSSDGEFFIKSIKGPGVLSMNRSIAYKIVDDQELADKLASDAVSLLVYWAQRAKDVQYATGTASEDSENPDGGMGMYLARGLWPFFVTYDIFKGTKYITAEQDAVIVAWFRNIEATIKACINTWDRNDYFGKQEWNNWLAAHMWGLLTIGYVLDDSALVQFAIDSDDNPRDFYELIEGCIFMEGDTPCIREKTGNGVVETGELYDRFRHDTAPLKGLQYTSLELQILSSAARTCYNNGIDMYAYTAPTGENLRLCYDYYADYYSTLDCSIHNGYYAGEDSRISMAQDMQGLFELGYNAYPDSEKILSVINAIKNRAENKVQMHDILGYTRLYSIDADSEK